MFKTILCASDGSAYGERAIAFAVELADVPAGSLRVVHVAAKLPGGMDVNADEERRIAKLKLRVAALRRHGVSASLHVIRGARVGDVPRLIAETAEAVGADVIIVGPRGSSPLGGMTRRSLTARLLAVARRPVLAVPMAREAATGEPAHAGARVAAA